MNDKINYGYSNYKGVMLCVRPEDRNNIAFEKPFCSNVLPKRMLGIDPLNNKRPYNNIRNRHMALESKKHNYKLRKHKEFIKSLEEEMRNKKLDYINAVIKKAENRERLKRKMKQRRDIIRNVNNIPDNEKPLFCQTTSKIDEINKKEEEELIDFIENFDYENVIKDIENKEIIESVNKRVEEIQKEKNWMDILNERVKEKHEKERIIEENIKLKRSNSEDNLMNKPTNPFTNEEEDYNNLTEEENEDDNDNNDAYCDDEIAKKILKDNEVL